MHSTEGTQEVQPVFINARAALRARKDADSLELTLQRYLEALIDEAYATHAIFPDEFAKRYQGTTWHGKR